MLIAVIVFILEFVPVVGAYISGAIGILFALTQGWQVALIYAIFVTIMQGVLDGQILAPRILGRSVGIHPIISIFALIAMAQLFGLFGALLAVPLAACALDVTIVISSSSIPIEFSMPIAAPGPRWMSCVFQPWPLIFND